MKFLASQELGRLAKWLRILGFDTVYFKDNNKSSLIITAMRENRIVLTRNNIILKDKALKTIFVKSQKVKDQLKEVFSNLSIEPDEDLMFSRCTVCNSQLESLDKEKAKPDVPEYVFQTQNEFYRCKVCSRIYWRGTHWGNVKEALKEICK